MWPLQSNSNKIPIVMFATNDKGKTNLKSTFGDECEA
jgi:hypothetical protein